ncbi:hypothetical protein [Streptomyces sp. NBC_01518]|uniref:hypothetical protein n=1 Tax=Streptomyces sp. NBC_01518 TaxID=2903891 RepID=UPI00386BE875
MPNLPPPVWAELFYGGVWNTITDDARVTTSAVTISRGLSSESSSDAAPTACSCDLDSRDNRYAPRNPTSPLYGLIGRNTPWRHGYTVGTPWAAMAGLLGSDALETPDAAALDVAGDFDLRLDVSLESWAESQMLALRYIPGSAELWALEMINGFPMFMWSPDGTFASRISKLCSDELKAYNGQRLALRVVLDINNGAGGFELRFYTGRTVDDTEWNLLGAPIVGTPTTSVFPGTAPLEIGCGTAFNALPSGGVLNRLRGKVYALKLLDGTTTKVNMKTSAATAGGTSFVDATGLTWTKQGSAVLTNKHIRMAGEVPAWPPTRDLSGNDNYVSITPAGVTRRMDAGNKPVDSALLRYIRANNPIECWPLTDGIDATGGKSMVGGRDMAYYLSIGTELPVWQGGKLKDWVEDVVTFKAETAGQIAGGVPASTSAAAAWSVDFFMGGGGDGSAGTFEINDRGAGTDADNRIRIQLSYDAVSNDITIFRGAFGETSSSSALLTSVSNPGIYDGSGHHIRFSADPGATSTGWEIFVDGVSKASGTMASLVVKAVRDIRLNWGLISGGGISTADQMLGYVTYWDGTGPSAANIYAAFTGFQGELAGDRIERLATEAGYTATVAGESVFQRPMGIQGSKKLLDLMNEASATNFGYLVDRRDAPEVIHRGQSTLWNQPPGLTLDYSAGLISPPFKPVDDDKLTENDVSVQRAYGSVPAREVLETGAMSVLDPEDGGVGRYDTSYTYSVETDDQADQVAGMRVHLGTYDGVRYARITLNLANARVFALIDDILRIDVGDKIRLTNLPADHGPDAVDVLVAGYSEEAGPDAWLITFNCVPGEPWNAAVANSSVYGIADTGGSILAEALDSTETGVDVFTTGLARWIDSATYAAEFPFDVRTGGEVMRVTACTSAVQDTFTRSASSSWGTANVGGTWTNTGGAAADYSVTGSVGAHSLTSVNVNRHSVIPAPSADVDILVDVATSALATGGSQYVGALARHADVNNHYYARATFQTTQAIQIVLQKKVGGVQTDMATVTTPYTHAAATFFRIRFQVTGSTLNAKVWPVGGLEPTAWQATVTDTALTAAGSVGVRSVLDAANTNTLPLTVSYDNFAVLNPQTFTVTRSINGVVKSHSAGQDVRLAGPVYAGM